MDTGNDENGLVIDIIDDGVGMDEETLKHIYDKHKVNYHSNGVGVYNVQQRLVLILWKGLRYHLSQRKRKGNHSVCCNSRKAGGIP